jgi:hypothetical protein
MVAANGVTHKVDVSARIRVVGIDVTWIVECKQWKRRVTMVHVSALKDIVNDLAADRGLMMSELGFQAGAIKLATAKNITLSNLTNLRANAFDDLLMARVIACDLRLLNMSHTLVQSLRVFGGGFPRLLPELIKRLSSEDQAEFASREVAGDFDHDLAEIASRAGVTSVRDILPSDSAITSMAREWRHGVDEDVMEAAFSAVGDLTQALDRARLGDLPVVCLTVLGATKLAWTIEQLLGVIEPELATLEKQIDEQEQKLR